MAIVLASLAGPAEAQIGPTDSPACRRDCNVAGRPDRRSLPSAVQACLIRCQSQERFFRQEGRSGAASASGLGVAPGGTPPRHQAPPGYAPMPYAPPGAPPPRAGQFAARAPQAFAGAVYTALPPAGGIGLSVGLGDRLAAHRGAENDCLARNGGAPCMLLAETSARCVAVGQLVQRSAGALVVTADPRTYRITAYAYGAGATSAEAEQAAMGDCQRRDARSSCRIAMARCAGG